MLDFIFNRKSKSKLLLVGSSSGSYPYPRVHTPLMLIPNKRNQQEDIKENTVKRRPPLNKAIPTIPESKSNESIMSHTSKASTSIQKPPEAAAPPDSLVIANRVAVESLGRQTATSLTAIPRKTSGSSRNESREPPRSPLMSVAKTVKSKLTRLTRLGRSTESTNMKGSQSFSGVRSQKPIVPKRMDENANRVIKSSSMDPQITIASDQPSTSRVVIPQNPEPLCSPEEKLKKMEFSMEETPVRPELDDREVIGTVDYHLPLPPVATVVSEIVESEKQTVMPMMTTSIPTTSQRTVEETNFVIKTEKVVTMTMSFTELDGDKENVNLSEVREKFEMENEKQEEEAVARPTKEEPMETDTETTLDYSMPRSVSGILEQQAAKVEMKSTQEEAPPKKSRKRPEEPYSPPRYVLTAKTPEASRKHHTFVIGEVETKAEVTVETASRPGARETKKKERVQPEEPYSPPRYILTAKTPEASRKHQTFMIGEAEHKPEITVPGAARPGARDLKKKERVRSEEEDFSPPTYILTAKTPEMNRKHTTFMIGEAEPVPDATSLELEKTAAPVKKEKKVRTAPEEHHSPPRYILTAKTPLTTRKHLAFSIGEKLCDQVDAQPEEPAKQKKKKDTQMKRSKSEEPTYTRYVMKVKTPGTIRRHHTFIVGERGKECSEQDLNMVHRRLEDFRQRSLSSQITGSQSFEFKQSTETSQKLRSREELLKKRDKKLLRQRSQPESEDRKQTRFILITKAKTPLPIRRCNTFMVGERAPSPDVPYIEEGEITEPIATVGPMAYKKRTVSEEPRKMEEDEDKKERFVMTVKTPLAMRKFQTFVVDEKPSPLPSSRSEGPFTDSSRIKTIEPSGIKLAEERQEHLALGHSSSQAMDEKDIITRIIEDALHKKESDYEEPIEPIRPSDMYVLTTTTPVAQRKNRLAESDEARSPIGGRLFVMGKRQITLTEKEERGSQSDRAERKSIQSGELTSPEEEIPMDTMPSPLDNINLASIIIQTQNTVCTFRAPSPPKFQPLTSSKSTSPVKSPSSYEPASTSSESRRILSSASTDNEEKRKKTKKEKNQMKAPLATRSLRSAGKMLTPSFFRKTKNKAAPVKSMSFPSRPNMNLNIRDRQAPLAEFESSVVGDSPLVENMPLTFEKWSSSPRNRRRYSEKVAPFTETIMEESDGNGNPKCIVSPLLHRHDFNHSELIDDEILDQPMLMGDNFSHSESSEILARRATDYENERSTLISIDRSLADEYHDGTPSRRTTEANNNGTQHTQAALAASRLQAADLKMKEEVQDSLGELAALKGTLQHLQAIVNQEMISEAQQTDGFDTLMKENDALRREIHEKDSLITQLKQQLALVKQQPTQA